MSAIIPTNEIAALAKTDQDFVNMTEHIRELALADLQNNRDFDELADMRAKARALGSYIARKVQSREAKIEARNNIAEVVIRTERQIGTIIKAMQESGELASKQNGRPKKSNTMLDLSETEKTVSEVLKLEDVGITHIQSARWQAVASLPEEKFEEYICERKENNLELTSAGVQSYGRFFQNKQRREEAAQTPAPTGKYKTIVIDPPWPVEKIEREERPNQGEYLDYPTMTLEQIRALDIRSLAFDDGCHLYLWTTQKYLPEAISMVGLWGFNYQCVFTWVKPTGMTPYSWMYNTEFVVFARFGSLDLQRHGLKLSFEAPTIGHSVKPDVFYTDRVVPASPEPRLEMFARKTREGFTVWGNEVTDAARCDAGLELGRRLSA